MSPILVRPVREQLEHDRVIRLLQAKYKRKFDVAINPGNEQAAAVGTAADAWYPDLVLHSSDRGRRLQGVVEVETAESVNHLEAMSQWAALSRLRAPFHLYVPIGSVDTARRLSTDLHIAVAELWAYNALGDQMRFTLVERSAAAEKALAAAASKVAAPPRTTGGKTNGSARANRPTTARPPSGANATRAQKASGKPRAAAGPARSRKGATKTATRASAKKVPARAQKRK